MAILFTTPAAETVSGGVAITDILLDAGEVHNQRVVVSGLDFNDLSTFSVSARISEGANTTGTTVPTTLRDGAASASLVVIGQGSTNTFRIRLDAPALIAGSADANGRSADPQPTLGNPIWYFYEITLDDNAAEIGGQAQNVVRTVAKGKIRISFSL